jgi:hypothetical protein
MSITYRTYVGPYARCAITLVDTKKLQIGCANTACEYYGKNYKTKFCQACGQPIGSITHIEQEPSVDQWDVSEQLEERLTTPGGDEYDRWMRANLAQLWIPNVRSSWRSGHLEEREDFALVPISADQVINEQLAFQEFFTTEFAALMVRYGADNVRIEWGVIQDYS